MSTNRFAVIVAGGSGQRMGSETPKQFLMLNGKPILMHTIERFASIVPMPDIVLVLPQSQMDHWKNLCEELNFDIKLTLVAGGNTRYQSVKNGLTHIPSDNSLVAIHDGVRPFVSTQVIEQCYATATQKGSAIPVIKPVESVRLVQGNISKAFDRNSVLLVQTPQVFQSKLIKDCYNVPEQPFFTDDASVFESQGFAIHTVEGNRENIKITTPFDLLIAEMFISKK
ncbi:MAG TPA: 2-C-methyl-D-erythritol 4-phosphate cytidylyltransferase [Bacteroidales bacterium]|nr:2-C-methyl-D-erythritol 4-phosphate cytidylyltransferase [Bacteroidales bacterium]